MRKRRTFFFAFFLRGRTTYYTDRKVQLGEDNQRRLMEYAPKKGGRGIKGDSEQESWMYVLPRRQRHSGGI